MQVHYIVTSVVLIVIVCVCVLFFLGSIRENEEPDIENPEASRM